MHIIDVWRGRLEFPELLRKAGELAQLHAARTILVEDKASGQQLIQAMRSQTWRGVPHPILRNPEMDKLSRAAGVSSMFEAGQVYLPEKAHWLDTFKKELLSFPNSRHDDQADALSQLLGWVGTRWSFTQVPCAGPLLSTMHDDGSIEVSGDLEGYEGILDGDYDTGDTSLFY